MSLRFEKSCYPDVNVYQTRKNLGLNPIPRKPNVWSTTSRSTSSGGESGLIRSASNILGNTTSRKSTTFNRSFKRLGYRHDLEHSKDLKKENEYCLYTNKISNSDEHEYGIWKRKKNVSSGAYEHPSSIGFFKNRVNESAPKWMQLKSIQPSAFFKHKNRLDNEKIKEKQFKLDRLKNEDRTTAGSFDTPDWFKTDRNGIKPIKNSKTFCHGNQTLLKSHESRGFTGRGTGVMQLRPDLSLLENRTARSKLRLKGPHNRIRTEMVEFCRAAVKQGIKPF
jgi:hypothetical protein